jgi:LysM repeat protein
MKFTIMVDFIIVLLAALLWNMQPWFKIEIKPIKAKTINAPENSDKALQSNVEIINYDVQPGDTLSEIAERYSVSLSTLKEFNGLDDPNVLRTGKPLKIPRRRNG